MTLAITGFAAQSVVLMGAAEIAPGANFSFDAPTFSPTNAVRLTGTKDAGSSVVVTRQSTGSTPLCTIPASSDTDFSCIAALANGGAITLTAVQTRDGVASDPRSATIDVLGAPTMDGTEGFHTTGIVSGYGFAGSTVTPVFDDGTIGCSSTATDTGFWSCPLTVPSGDYVVRVQQSRADLGGGASSSLSGSVTLVVDRDAPARAVITSPAAGSRVTSATVTITGTGEAAPSRFGGVADLYLDNAPACQSRIVDGAFSCALEGVTPGTHTLRVIQRDAAGNYSAPSQPITVYFGVKNGSSSSPPNSSDPSASPPSSSDPPSSDSSASPPSSSDPSASPPSEQPSGPPSAGPGPYNFAPAAPPGGSGDNWGTPTAFGAMLPTLSSSATAGNMLLVPLLALAFVVLVALPLRLLTGALGGHFRIPSIQFTGRNRSRITASAAAAATSTPVNRWLAGAIPLAAAAGLILIAGGVDDQVRYLRLAIAVVVGLAVLNVVGVAIATRLGSTAQGVSGRLRFVPMLLLAVLLAAVLSRATGIQPPVIAGVLIGVSFAETVGVRARAIVSLVEISAVTALASVAWLLHALFVSPEGFWPLLATESLTTIALAGLGSVVVLVLPIATLPGRAVFEWSRPAWLATVSVVALLASAVLLGVAGTAFPIIGAVLTAGAFAALSVAVWGWLRFVDPVASNTGAG
ncbi:MAG: Ig-like domain-containing protein [Candidatus Saccharibacteria bacterium]|nr:Ig-like domain-containing protein [Microbacteriaceae bacterium]